MRIGVVLDGRRSADEVAEPAQDTCQFTTWIEADVPQVQCGTHGVKQLRVPWAEPSELQPLPRLEVPGTTREGPLRVRH
jgi:hypothetical protein